MVRCPVTRLTLENKERKSWVINTKISTDQIKIFLFLLKKKRFSPKEFLLDIFSSLFSLLLQHRTPWHQQEEQTENSCCEEVSKPNVQPHHGVRRLPTWGPKRGLCGAHSVGSWSTEQPLHRGCEAGAGDRSDLTPLLLFGNLPLLQTLKVLVWI